jgi:MraZ protein
MVLTFNPREHCLLLYPLPVWDTLEKKLVALPDFDEQASLVKRVMQGTAMECEIDGQGRILVPDLHKEHARLEKRVAYCGAGERFELWDEEAWKQQVARCQELYKVAPSDAVKNLAL